MFRILARVGERELRCLVGDSPVVVGADEQCDFVLREPTVSRRHARLLASGDALEVEDLGSRNGVFIDRLRVSGRGSLRAGQLLRLGEVEIQIEPAAARDAELAVTGVLTPTRLCRSSRPRSAPRRCRASAPPSCPACCMPRPSARMAAPWRRGY